ncbi:hypothetical protein GS597_09225 [Synechococcales cyanobacterium C]|uniref:Uncharacterized protein n=1 Tax=Petrachloros mirabilis ULC683 TaxID=2781853 RepID=A0A8K2A7Y6_9CYAN|nr:hypothetical protein [Petrachloros mirabilis]NCJ06684.1 hypothetical protein [Petrachloros mirabilis ULC683]
MLVEFDRFEFEDVSGQIRSVRGCSLMAREELRQRLTQLSELLADAKDDETLEQLYDRHNYFRWVCHRCLELCNIRPEWVSVAMLRPLLFHRKIGTEYQPGDLLRLNFPQKPAAEGKSANYSEVLAALWTQIGDLQKALTVAADGRISAEELLNTMEAKALQSPEAREEARKAEYKAKAKAKRQERGVAA